MQSWALLTIVAMLSAAGRMQAYPLFSGSNHILQGVPADVFQTLGESNEGDLRDRSLGDEETRQFKSLYPLLQSQDDDDDVQGSLRTTWIKGNKDSVQQEKMNNMVDDIKNAVLKLAAAEKLRSHGFVKSEQNTPKATKRACFWKYCVTN
ncbi:urotensin-related peptide 1 [Erpetoichthys calabaricus]|uniref:urotensin-related peptide 1 n=1 Tax=Erpetoichthys calabaricus TaxID=27687 RepID=UPI0022348649|nr:urotensin-related peptide 1 [Erpetoichthys calabaricus]